jgi:predicted small secreted protein
VKNHSIPTTKGIAMRKNLAIAFISLVVLTGASTFLTACNTVEGAGRDVSKAGGAITEEAKEHK